MLIEAVYIRLYMCSCDHSGQPRLGFWQATAVAHTQSGIPSEHVSVQAAFPTMTDFLCSSLALTKVYLGARNMIWARQL